MFAGAKIYKLMIGSRDLTPSATQSSQEALAGTQSNPIGSKRLKQLEQRECRRVFGAVIIIWELPRIHNNYQTIRKMSNYTRKLGDYREHAQT